MKTNFKKQFILLLLFFHGFQSECNTGCLKCSADKLCQLCDFSKNMFLKEEKCQQAQISNCTNYSIAGDCLSCSKGYFLDTAQQKCIMVTTEQAISNCDIYLSSTTCLKCADKYYLSGTVCEAVVDTIENCIAYSGNAICLECNQNYVLSIDNKKCDAISAIQNCQTYSNIQCLSCQENLYQQQNAKSVLIESQLKENSLAKAQSAMELFLNKFQTTENNCFATNLENCKTLDTFEKCGVCNDGYYQKNNLCVENPQEAIYNCLKYVKIDRCHTCDIGYHLTLDYKCQQNKFVNNCISYNGQAYDQTECLKCEENFYLIQKNYCQQRENFKIENCADLHIKLDTCGTCNDGFRLTTDGLACLPIIEFCDTYYNSTQYSKSLVCLQCINGYYINNEGQCTTGSIANCKIYQRAVDKCSLCQDKFYLAADETCKDHTVIENCDKYHHLLNNKCEQCSFDSYLLNTATQCVQTTISNCKTHIKKDYCGECEELYMLDNGKCLSMSTTFPNCLIGEYNVCKKCKDKYILEKGKCVETFTGVTLNCEVSNFKEDHTTHSAQCEICKTQNIPYNFKGSYMCTSDAMVTSLGLTANIEDCLSYRVDKDGKLKCTECSGGKKIAQDGSCTTQVCNTQLYTHLLETNNDKVKIVKKQHCTADNGSKCSKYGIQKMLFSDNKEVKYECTKCKSGNSSFVTLNQTDQIFSYIDDTKFKWNSKIECYTDTELSGYMKSSSMTDCEYFYMIRKDTVGCLKCKPGKKGIVKNYLIENCAEHDANTQLCIKCQRNYYLDTKKENCIKSKHVDVATGVNLTHMNNCESMAFDQNKCYECKPGYYLSDNGQTCTQFTSTITNCAKYIHNASSATPKCSVCNNGYTLSDDKANCNQDHVNCIKKSSAQVCSDCKDQYYINNAVTGGCSQVSNCILNKKNQNVCLVTYQNFRYLKTNKCELVNVTNCSVYNTNGTCKECDNTHYLIENTCSTVNTFKDQAAYTNIRNCYSYEVIDNSNSDDDLKYGCKQCKNGYHFKDTNRARGTYDCIQDGYVKYGAAAPVNVLNLVSYSSGECIRFDFSLNKCVLCKSTYYMSNGICCTEGNQNINGTCGTIGLSECLRAQFQEKLHGQNECLKCTATTHVLVDGQCCAAATSDYIDASGACAALPTQCKTIDSVTKQCSECNTGHYLHPQEKFCCPEKQVHISGGTCKALSHADYNDVPYIANLRNAANECLQFDGTTLQCLKCKEGFSYNGKVCQSTTNLFANCKYIDTLTNTCSQCNDNYIKTDINICCNKGKQIDLVKAECVTTLDHTAIVGCAMHKDNAADDAYECETCEDDKVLKTGICCYNYQTNTNSACVDPAYDNSNCLLSSSTDQSCLLCRVYNSSGVKLHLSSNKCCPVKTYNNSGTCTNLTDTNCLIPKSSDATKCTKCADGYYLSGAEACVALISNCDTNAADGTCTGCVPGYVLDKTSANCVAINNNLLEGCLKFDATLAVTDQCLECRSGFNEYTSTNVKFCCALNYYYDTELKKCTKIEDEYCTTYNSTKQCTDCFQDDQKCVKSSSGVPQLVTKYYLSNGKCVMKGKYYNGTTIKDIQVTNCLKIDVSNNECTECKLNYYILNGRCELIKDCVNYVDTNNKKYYMSNDNCCMIGKFYDKEQGGCVQLSDTNCEQSQDGITCDECADTYSPQKLQKKYDHFNLAHKASQVSCGYYQKTFTHYQCVLTTTLTNSAALKPQQTKVLDNCIKYDSSSKQCEKCEDGYYKQKDSDICCQEGSISITTDEGYQFCKQLSLIKENCKNYDFKNQKCLECNATFELSQGRCCAAGTYFNELTNACDITVANCKSYDSYAKVCVTCKDTYYLSNGICCVEGEVSNDGSTCTAMSDNCKIKDDFGLCHKCAASKQLTFNNCCDANNYYKFETSACALISTLGDGYANCSEVDDHLNCLTCTSSEVLMYGRCCPSNAIWNYNTCTVPSNNASDNCLEYVQFTATELAGMTDAATDTANIKCKKCETTHYSISGKCILIADIYDLETNFSLSAETQALLNVNLDCLEWVDGVCDKCITGKILKYNSTGDNETTCITGTALSNCHVHKDDATQCWYCKDGHYASDSGGGVITCDSNVSDANCLYATDNGCQVCKDGYHKDSDDGKCKEIPIQFCEIANGSLSQCEVCNEGYALNISKNKCIQIKTLPSNCLTGMIENDGSFTCLACIEGYELDETNSNACTKLTGAGITNCRLHKKVTGPVNKCMECHDGYRLEHSETLCCHDTEVLNSSNTCQSVLQFNRDCKSFNIVDVDNIGTTSIECTDCKTGYYLVQKTCCLEGTFYDGQDCVESTQPSTQNCKQYTNNGLCKQIDTDDLTANCKSGYLTFQRCCPEQKYFDFETSTCTDIPTYLSLDSQTCIQINDDMQCIKCSDMTAGRVYEGYCVSAGKYLELQTMSLIEETTTASSFTNCSVVKDQKCLQCKTGFQLGNDTTSSSKCCWNTTDKLIYNEMDQKCQTLSDINCTTYDYSSKQCTTCASGYFTGTICCADDKYYTNGQCTDISTIDKPWTKDCKQITDDDLKKEQCSVCKSGKIIQDGICCAQSFNISGKCYQSALECKQMDENFNCTECKDGSFLTGDEQKLCCSSNKVITLNSTTKEYTCETVTSTSITQCSVYETTSKCQTCNATYHLDNNKCCAVGSYNNNGTCTSVLVAECIEFETRETQVVCKKCKDTFNVFYYKESDNLKSICCADGQTLDFATKKCVALSKYTTNCKEVDIQEDDSHVYGLGPQCITPADNFYISNGVPCADNSYWDGMTCNTTIPATYPNCVQVSEQQCLKCDSTTTRYLIGGRCCSNKFYNNSGTCTDGSAGNCKYYYHECPTNVDGLDIDCSTFAVGQICKECDNNFYLTYAGKCCANKSYYDKDASTCKTYASKSSDPDYRTALSTCKKFDKDLNCLECDAGTLSDDKKSCCDFALGFVNNSKTCSATHNVPTGCKTYDAIKFECTECINDYYLTNEFCCANGKYFNVNTYTCDTINTTTLSIHAQCNQYKVKGGCVGCNTGYELDRKEQCIQIPLNCNNFDADLKICFGCKDNFYLSEGVCCEDTKYSVNGTCTLISTTNITNCNKMQNGMCIECANNYYERLGYCCQEGYYHNSLNDNLYQCIQYPTSGELKDCLQFGADKHECLKCKQNYVLTKYDRNKFLCQKIQTQTSNTHVNFKCIEYSQSYVSDTKGEGLTCTKCDQTGATGYYKLTNLTTDSFYEESDNAITKPSNCSIIDLQSKFIDSTLKCLRCNTTHYLNNRNECVLRTNTNCVGYVPYDQDVCEKCASGFYLTLRKECKAIPITDCIRYDALTELCLQCDTSDNTKNMQLHYELISNVVQSKCIDIQLYDLNQQDKRVFVGYIDSCSTDDTFQVTNKFASNLEYWYDYFYNVHYCTNDKIPVTFVRMGTDQTGMPEGIGYYSILNDNQVSTYDLDDYFTQLKNGLAETPGSSTQCITALRDIFPYFTNDVIGTHLPSNCAMLMVNVSRPLSTTESLKAKPDLSKLSVFCSACKDGFKAIRNSRVPMHVYQCEAISNCTTSSTGPNILNGCSECESGYAYGITDGKVDYTKCISTTDTNCLATLPNNKCQFCKQGQVLNYDNKCSKITPPNCQDAQFSFTDEFNIKNFGFVNSFLDGNKGCVNCNDGYVGIYQDKDRYLCSGSQTLVENDFTATSLVYDAQCQFYGLDNNKTICKTCNSNYIITQTHKCIAIGDMTNCDIAITTGECYKCKDTHVNVNKKCVEKTIENCKSYISSPSQQTLQCLICEDGFLLNGNVCEEGHVENCAGYDDRVKCIKCKPNHVLTFMNNLQRCLLIAENLHPNCIRYNSNQFQEDLIVCEECSSNQFVVEDLFKYQDFCISVPTIENCAIYDKGNRLIDSSFKCLRCADGYRLEDNKCNLVSDRDQNCEEFQLPGYECLQCKLGYYLDEQGEKCLQQPLGVQGCAYYKNITTCKYCKTGLYLKKNRCIEVPTSNIIEFCKYYQNETTCLQCDDTKILENNKCLEPVAQCLTYYNINECRTCPEGKGIQIIDGHRQCVDIIKKDFCAEQKNIDPFECIACTNGYYLNGGACIQISEPIIGCIQYDGDLSCALCENGLVLASNKKSCQSIAFNDKCAQYIEKEPFCVYCSPGYTLRDQQCVKAESNIPKNCLGIDINGQCNICLPGYTMNEKFECN